MTDPVVAAPPPDAAPTPPDAAPPPPDARIPDPSPLGAVAPPSDAAALQPDARSAALDRLVAAYDTVMHRAAALHTPEFLDVALTMSQAKVLYLLAMAGPLRISEVARRLSVAMPTASQLVDRLVEQGTLARADDPGDRRHVVVHATPSGMAQLDRFRELGNREFRRFVERVDAADLRLLEEAFGVLLRAIDAVASASNPATPLTEEAAL